MQYCRASCKVPEQLGVIQAQAHAMCIELVWAPVTVCAVDQLLLTYMLMGP